MTARVRLQIQAAKMGLLHRMAGLSFPYFTDSLNEELSKPHSRAAVYPHREESVEGVWRCSRQDHRGGGPGADPGSIGRIMSPSRLGIALGSYRMSWGKWKWGMSGLWLTWIKRLENRWKKKIQEKIKLKNLKQFSCWSTHFIWYKLRQMTPQQQKKPHASCCWVIRIAFNHKLQDKSTWCTKMI